MPANKKHLTKSPWIRWSKILAGTVGGYMVMLSFHVFLTSFLPKEEVIITSFITGYLLWAILLLTAFIVRNVCWVWLSYLVATALFSLPYLIANY